jgi:hypothetical protein
MKIFNGQGCRRGKLRNSVNQCCTLHAESLLHGCRTHIGSRPPAWRATEPDSCHAGHARTGPNDMNATAMQLERHERGIHAL